MKTDKQLIKEYEAKVLEITEVFLKKYLYDDLSKYQISRKAEDGFVCNEIGGVFLLNEYYLFGFDRIIEALKLNASVEKFYEYLDYEFEFFLKEKAPEVNFKNFIKYGLDLNGKMLL